MEKFQKWISSNDRFGKTFVWQSPNPANNDPQNSKIPPTPNNLLHILPQRKGNFQPRNPLSYNPPIPKRFYISPPLPYQTIIKCPSLISASPVNEKTNGPFAFVCLPHEKMDIWTGTKGAGHTMGQETMEGIDKGKEAPQLVT